MYASIPSRTRASPNSNDSMASATKYRPWSSEYSQAPASSGLERVGNRLWSHICSNTGATALPPFGVIHRCSFGVGYSFNCLGCLARSALDTPIWNHHWGNCSGRAEGWYVGHAAGRRAPRHLWDLLSTPKICGNGWRWWLRCFPCTGWDWQCAQLSCQKRQRRWKSAEPGARWRQWLCSSVGRCLASRLRHRFFAACRGVNPVLPSRLLASSRRSGSARGVWQPRRALLQWRLRRSSGCGRRDTFFRPPSPPCIPCRHGTGRTRKAHR